MQQRKLFWASLFYLSLLSLNVTAQQRDSLNKVRRNTFLFAGLVGTTAAHISLASLWYSDYPRTSFHFFNDNREWNQMDKYGHVFSAYYLGDLAISAGRYSGVSEKKLWKWGLFGSIFQNPIEIWDGMSAGWGASWGDLAANTLGTVLLCGQQAAWHEQRVRIKYGYVPSRYAEMRPGILGENTSQRIFKDYNAQTYWLSVNTSAFIPRQTKAKWFSLALGFGSDGMLGGTDNRYMNLLGQNVDRSDIKRYRQWYLAPDIDFSRIPTKKKWLKTVFLLMNCVKFPLPAMELNYKGISFHPVTL